MTPTIRWRPPPPPPADQVGNEVLAKVAGCWAAAATWHECDGFRFVVEVADDVTVRCSLCRAVLVTVEIRPNDDEEAGSPTDAVDDILDGAR